MHPILFVTIAAVFAIAIALIAYHQGRRSRQPEINALHHTLQNTTTTLLDTRSTLDSHRAFIKVLYGIITRRDRTRRTIPLPNRCPVQQAVTDSGALLRFGMN